ncbi:alpha/beta fold hydrolase [Streptomyces cylindrosporus]|uniref:Uncharacterized protein n=1 Tax=Streptomyces cylindrosporus TaxID=2927583 RepID=A0ABS9YCH7_9ACTN|nr:hypothetical protein [Streptomyces cylindrosporus]MCI3274941.1 hypothetical protein [Streptomyces cylindrosporus]
MKAGATVRSDPHGLPMKQVSALVKAVQPARRLIVVILSISGRTAPWDRPGSAERHSVEVCAAIHERWLLGLAVDRGGRHAQRWAEKVSRIVLFASLNRGIEVSFARRWWLPVHDLLCSSDFVTKLRISWIREINRQDHPPLVTQFLGTNDDLVTADDSKDIEEFPTGRQEFIRDATHAEPARPDKAPDPAAVPEIGTSGKRVVMLLHGIRASNTTWVKQLEDQSASNASPRARRAGGTHPQRPGGA